MHLTEKRSAEHSNVIISSGSFLLNGWLKWWAGKLSQAQGVLYFRSLRCYRLCACSVECCPGCSMLHMYDGNQWTTLHSSDYSFNRTDCAGELTTVHKTCLDGKEGLVHPCSRPIPQVVHVKSKSLCSVVQCHCEHEHARNTTWGWAPTVKTLLPRRRNSMTGTFLHAWCTKDVTEHKTL